MKVAVGNEEYIINENSSEKTELKFMYKAVDREEFVRIRFDKISADMPCVYKIEVTK